MEILKNEQDYDDRAENDHPIGNLNTRYRCFLLEPFQAKLVAKEDRYWCIERFVIL